MANRHFTLNNAAQPKQIIGIQTNPLPIAKNGAVFPNPVFGSAENLLNNIKFYFPRLAAQAGDITAAKFFQAFTKSAGTADLDENADITKQYGNTLHRPKYGSVEFGNTDNQNQNGNQYTGIDGNTYTFPNILLPIALVSVSQPTNIVKTKITGRPGEVKQYIGALDKTITINSVVNYGIDQAPIAFLNALQQMKDAAVTIPITNYFLNALGVHYILIEDVSTPQEEGNYSNIAFTITACSDIPLFDFLP